MCLWLQIVALGYSQRFWLKYHFYFAYCEAAFDARYIHDFHVTWVKSQTSTGTGTSTSTPTTSAPAVTTTAAAAAAAAAAAGGGSVASTAALGDRVKQELPSDPVTQLLLALYFFLAGLLVQRHPHLYLMPLASTAAAMLQGLVNAVTALVWPSYTLMPPARQVAWCFAWVEALAAAVGAVGAAAVIAVSMFAASALAGGLDGGWVTRQLLVVPSAAAGGGDLGSLTVDLGSKLVCCGAGFFAYQLWLLVRTRGLFGSGAQVVGLWRGFLPLLTYTLLLVLFGVGGYKGEDVVLLAGSLIAGAAVAPAAVGQLLQLKGGGSSNSGVGRLMLVLERVMFVICR
jgi:hypothetical protein